jgi:RNA polymerase sporulation-specific sigma factor
VKDEEQLVNDNLNLVHMILRKYRVPRGYEYEDMYQEGCFGLCKAAKLYDPTKGYKFSTLATRVIENIYFKIFREQSTAKRTGMCVSIHTITIDDLEIIDMIVDEKTDTESEAIANDALNTLLDADKELITLRLDGMTQAEIGKRLGFAQSIIGRKLKKLEKLVV